MNNPTYEEYLKSNHWKRLAEEARRLAGYRCQLCNSEGELHVHHRTYERKGDEFQSDLIVLCASCHKLFHEKEKVMRLADLEVDTSCVNRLEEVAKERNELKRLLKVVKGTLMSYPASALHASLYERLDKLLGISHREAE